MIDCHIHIERGAYSLDWIDKFVQTAIEREIEEIWLLEHCSLSRISSDVWFSLCIQ